MDDRGRSPPRGSSFGGGGGGGGSGGRSGFGGGRRRDRRDETRSLHCRGYKVTETKAEDLRDVFKTYGKVIDVYLPKDFYTNKLRGFAYIQFENEKDAEDARLGLDRTDIFKDGNVCAVMWASGKRKTPVDMQRIDVERDNPHARERMRAVESRSHSPRGLSPRSLPYMDERDRGRESRRQSHSPDPRGFGNPRYGRRDGLSPEPRRREQPDRSPLPHRKYPSPPYYYSRERERESRGTRRRSISPVPRRPRDDRDSSRSPPRFRRRYGSPDDRRALLPDMRRSPSPISRRPLSPQPRRSRSTLSRRAVSPDFARPGSPGLHRAISPEQHLPPSPDPRRQRSPDRRRPISPDRRRAYSPDPRGRISRAPRRGHSPSGHRPLSPDGRPPYSPGFRRLSPGGGGRPSPGTGFGKNDFHEPSSSDPRHVTSPDPRRNLPPPSRRENSPGSRRIQSPAGYGETVKLSISKDNFPDDEGREPRDDLEYASREEMNGDMRDPSTRSGDSKSGSSSLPFRSAPPPKMRSVAATSPTDTTPTSPS